MKARLALTCGDPAGIGPEVVAGWLKRHPDHAGDVAVLGPARWLESIDLCGALAVPVGDADFTSKLGKPSVEGAKLSWEALERGAAGTKTGEFCGVVTGPVSKEWLQKAGYPFPGQTEFFAERWGGDATMAFCGGKLRVALLTWHIPFRDVPLHLTIGELRRTIAAASELALATTEASTGKPPRIGICGLNPHAGEAGLLGREELETIDPILNELRRDFPGVSRTQPADTIFARQLKGEFDVVVALYHDQGLAPLKTVDFDESVNVTLGLPFVRTSPDHGTAFGIAGQEIASGTSFENAVKVAQRLIAIRAAKR